MTLTRAVVAAATALTLTFALTLQPAHAADRAPPAAMPAMPEPGAPSAGEIPNLGDMSNAGKATGGTSPSRILRSIAGAQASVEPPPLRGQQEQNLYAKFARSVVLIVTPDALGSGAIINQDGTIITNWHVVEGRKTVGVIFKPQNTDTRVKESDAVQAKVMRIDQIADLAVVKVSSIPSDAKVIALGDPAKLSIGADVHAIGHPLGEVWSYTKGIVSQIRHDYEWTYQGSPVRHHADVVQTQTPINPGNSGGPLLNDAGELVGISTFGAAEGAQINFAIASNEVARFLRDTGDRLAPATVAAAPAPSSKSCEPATLSRHRTKENDGTVLIIDANCNGTRDTMLSIPDDKSKPILMGFDENENGVLEAIYVDENNDLKFDYVLFDTNEDGKTDLVGYDLDDNLEPGRIETIRA